MRNIVVIVLVILARFTSAAFADDATESQINDLISQMTLEEKVALVHANTYFSVAGVPRLGIPERWLSDGPMGVREDIGPNSWNSAGHTDDFVTYMPCPLALAASWNPELANDYGSVIGQEAIVRGKQIMLGPAINIQRTPLCGRNWEYMGEDPFLTSRIAVGYIQGEQAQGVASTVKHFAANNQETQRTSIDVEMDERTLREIYLPGFQAAVQEGGALCVMGAYNQFRGQHCCENDYLLNKILKGEWGFKGLVMSDWGGVHDTKEAALNGMDLEMGTSKPFNQYYLADAYLTGLNSGDYPIEGLNDKVRRNLRVMFALHMTDGGAATQPSQGSLNTVEHQTTSRKIAEQGMVLLKNDQNLLPLDTNKIHSIAVIGQNAILRIAHGGESAAIKSLYEVTPLEGIINRAGSAVNVTYSEGYVQPAAASGRRGQTRPATEISPDRFARAVEAAKSADVVIFIAGLNHNVGYDSEGGDRKDLRLPGGQDELISQVCDANPNTIVVNLSGGAIEMDPWLDKASAVLQAWYGGMECGNAIARILFGDVNPSGKLPCTFPRKLADSPAHAMDAYPGEGGKEEYKEGLLVGYRWYDTKQIAPLFPFGYGLSYSHFEYTNLKLTGGETVLNVECDVANTSKMDGEEVVQVYVHEANPALPRPDQELKGFSKVLVKSGQKTHVTIPLNHAAFAYYDPARGGWVAQQDDYTIRVGSSSRDIRLHDDWQLTSTTVEK